MPSLGDFDLKQKLGAGSFGTVYKAIRKSDGLPVVVKQVKIHEMSPAEKKVALAEVRVMNQFDSKFVVRCEGESFIEDDHLNLILEYCDAGDVKQYLGRQKKPLKEKTVQRIIVQLLLGLYHIHSKRVIHRDIKAANLFLCSHMRRVKIGDLGVARTLGATSSMAQTMVGTPYYMSPELVQGEPYNVKSDVWAAGCLLYELMTLKHPFNGSNQAVLLLTIMKGKYEPVESFGGNYSHELRNLLKWMLCKNVKRRLSVEEILCKDFFNGWVIENGFSNPLADKVAGSKPSSSSSATRKTATPNRAKRSISRPTRSSTEGPAARKSLTPVAISKPQSKSTASAPQTSGRRSNPDDKTVVSPKSSAPLPKAARSPRSRVSSAKQSLQITSVAISSAPVRQRPAIPASSVVVGNRRRNKKVPVRSRAYIPPSVAEKAAKKKREAQEKRIARAQREAAKKAAAERAELAAVALRRKQRQQKRRNKLKKSGSSRSRPTIHDIGLDYGEDVEDDASSSGDDFDSESGSDSDAWGDQAAHPGKSDKSSNPYAHLVFGKLSSTAAIVGGKFQYGAKGRPQENDENNRLKRDWVESIVGAADQVQKLTRSVNASESLDVPTATRFAAESLSKFKSYVQGFRKSDPLRQYSAAFPWKRAQRCTQLSDSSGKRTTSAKRNFSLFPSDDRRIAAALEAFYLEQLHCGYPQATVCSGMVTDLESVQTPTGSGGQTITADEIDELNSSVRTNNFVDSTPGQTADDARCP